MNIASDIMPRIDRESQIWEITSLLPAKPISQISDSALRAEFAEFENLIRTTLWEWLDPRKMDTKTFQNSITNLRIRIFDASPEDRMVLASYMRTTQLSAEWKVLSGWNELRAIALLQKNTLPSRIQAATFKIISK